MRKKTSQGFCVSTGESTIFSWWISLSNATVAIMLVRLLSDSNFPIAISLIISYLFLFYLVPFSSVSPQADGLYARSSLVNKCVIKSGQRVLCSTVQSISGWHTNSRGWHHRSLLGLFQLWLLLTYTICILIYCKCHFQCLKKYSIVAIACNRDIYERFSVSLDRKSYLLLFFSLFPRYILCPFPLSFTLNSTVRIFSNISL